MTTYYNFKNAADLRKLLAAIFDLSSGHNHDGTNSKAVTTGTPGAGVVDKTMMAPAALAADATGRAIMATDFFNAATVLAKFATDSLTNANLLKLIQDGAFVADADTRALFADGIFTAAKLASTARTHILNYPIEDLGAGADIAGRVLFEAPAGLDVTLVSAHIIPMGSSAGIDDSNTAVIALTDGSSNSIVSKTYDTDPQPPAAGVVGDLGSLSGTYKVLSAGEKLLLSITQGATADLPALMLQIVYTVTEAA